MPIYQAAIDSLRKLPTLQTPPKKAACLINTANQIVECVKEHYKNSDSEDLALYVTFHLHFQ